MRGRLESWKFESSEVNRIHKQIQELEALATLDQAILARRVLDIMRAGIWRAGVTPSLYPDRMLRIPIEEHPKIMRDLILDKEHKTYHVREELYKIVSEMK